MLDQQRLKLSFGPCRASIERTKERTKGTVQLIIGPVPFIRPVSADGTFSAGGYSWAPPLTGGFTVLELPSREEAIAWAARIAKACRCRQELRVFGFDPAS